MATITVQRDGTSLRDTVIYFWETLSVDDDGEAVELTSFADKTVQIGTAGGTTDGGATIVLEGTNEADTATAEWFPLTDPQGNAISATTSSILEQVTENPRWIRPNVTGGVGTDIDVILVCKR